MPLITALDKHTLDVYFLPHDIQRLEAYSRNQIEFRLILDLVSDISYLYFQGKIENLQIDTLQKVSRGVLLQLLKTAN